MDKLFAAWQDLMRVVIVRTLTWIAGMAYITLLWRYPIVAVEWMDHIVGSTFELLAELNNPIVNQFLDERFGGKRKKHRAP